MSAGAYVPRKGTMTAKIVDYLTEHPDEELDRDEIAAKFKDVSAVSVTSLLNNAAKRGVLRVQMRGMRNAYSAPGPAEPEEPSDGKLQIATYSDGDVSVHGGQLCDDGQVMYTRVQIEQLIARVTTPHITLGQPGAIAS